ncbi:hypothetical protein [Cetobacterium sp.]|uniref:hypothetical protein n=1 Tax=Cetobacterium sp. TaxID=2071632 RepID=UPI003F2D400D
MISNIANYIARGMEIYFSVDENKEIFKVPYIPPDVKISNPLEFELFENFKGQSLTLVGEPGLREITLESFFPNKFYRWLGNTTLAPLCLDFFLKNRNKVLRIVIISLSTRINMECIITQFTHSKKHNGDISYSLTIQEYINPKKAGGNGA